LIRVLCQAAALAVLALRLHGAPPELSAEEPMVFDGETQSLVARGNAVFTHENFRVEADEIRYFQAGGRAEALGNVRLTQPGFRLVTERLVYHVDARSFEVGRFRAGYPPLLIEGANASGTAEEMTLNNVVIHLGEPETASPNLSAEQVRLLPGRRILAIGARPGSGLSVSSACPPTRGTSPPGRPSAQRARQAIAATWAPLSAARSLCPSTTSFTSAQTSTSTHGAACSSVLRSNYSDERGQTEMHTSLSTGWISDQATLGDDYFRRPIVQQRYFGQFRHRQVTDERFFVSSDVTWLSDPEVLRDFRPEVFDRNHYPDAYVEGSYHFDDVIVSALTRFENGGDYATVERLPELRVDLLTSPLPGGLYHSGYALAAATSYGWADEPELHSNYLHAYYGLRRPVELADWLTLTPRFGGMYAHYADALLLAGDELVGEFQAADHMIGELGADLSSEFRAEWTYRNKTWEIDGLRHIMRPVVYWRHYGSSGDEDYLPITFQQATYEVQMPPINIRDWMGDDSIALSDLHFARVGVENALLTRASKGGGSRTLAALNLYQDYEIDEAEWTMGYAQLELRPASFLNFSMETGFKTGNMALQYRRARLDLLSGNNWRATLYSDFLDGRFHDYVGQYFYQLMRDWGIIVSLATMRTAPPSTARP
jgi:LPS-assembly protein